MQNKTKPWWPGKPGPAPTGLKRDILFPLALSKEEWEHLARLEKEAKDKNLSLHKKAQIVRARVFRRDELDRLRDEQGPNIPV